MRLIRAFKNFAKRHWPPLRLRVILFGTLLLVAALPGVAALFLRVYENTLVQQTEAELVAEGAVLGAAYKVAWLGGSTASSPDPAPPEPPAIDLYSMKILPPQPAATLVPAGDPHAARAALAVAPIAREAAAVTLASTRLLDANGTVVLGRGDSGRSYAGLEEVRAALAGRAATVLRLRSGRGGLTGWLAIVSRASAIRVHHARPVIADGRVIGVVMLSRSPRGLFVGLYQDRGKIILGIILILGVLVVLVGLLSRGIARPIDALSRASRDVAVGPVQIPETPVTAAIEIRELYANFAAMAERIDRRQRYLRDFAAALAHEFKTPLAGIRGVVELLEDHGETMRADERRRFVANIAADADRLQRLVQRLLDLARADMTTIGPDAATNIATVIADLEGIVPGIAVDSRIAPELPPVRTTPEVLRSILATLIENSRYAGARRVLFEAARIGDDIELAVMDDGSGIAPADRERIFEPFFTGRRENGGTGLGLAIVRSLLSASNSTIFCTASETGARFVITLPTAISAGDASGRQGGAADRRPGRPG